MPTAPPPPSPATQPREFLRHLLDAAIARARPARTLAGFLPAPPRGRTLVLGAGKAAGAMAQCAGSRPKGLNTGISSSWK